VNLRPYQHEAVNCCFERWKEDTSTLVVVPTGGGKTQIFSEVIRRFLPQRALVLAHREELIFQAKDRIERIAAVECQVEMADLTASNDLFQRSPCVVSTVQTLHKRLARFDPMSFGLVIVDEAHHGTASSYVKILEHFKQNTDLRILGVTATPDRADEEALGQIFDSVAFDYEILDAINDGWLVPVDQQFVRVEDLDFSNIRTTDRDLNGVDLARLMEAEENLQGVCGSSINIIGNRQSILFAASVKHAEMACEIFNRHRPGMATFVCGATDKETRRERIAAFKAREVQVLCNVGIATEGSDFPDVAVILMGRPTKSRSLYAQMAGRALRPLTGLVDCFDEAEARKSAIAGSTKPSALLVDFVGNSGKHKLMTSIDILGGKVSDEAAERALAKAQKEKGQVRMVDVLEEAEEELRREKEARRLAEEARRARVVAKVQYSTRKVNPFDVLDITPVKERGWDSNKKLSEKQLAVLLKNGIDGTQMPYSQGKQLVDQIFGRWGGKLATFKQCSLLKKHYPEINVKNLSMKEAGGMIDALAKNGWRRVTPPPQKPTPAPPPPSEDSPPPSHYDSDPPF
jgi:superfamily II DNA or RNA helicase